MELPRVTNIRMALSSKQQTKSRPPLTEWESTGRNSLFLIPVSIPVSQFTYTIMNRSLFSIGRQALLAFGLFALSFGVSSCGENLEVSPTASTEQSADTALKTTLHLGDVVVGAADNSSAPATRAIYDYAAGSTALPRLQAGSNFKAVLSFYNKTRGTKAWTEVNWVVAYDAAGKLEFKIKYPTVSVTSLGTTAFTVAANDEVYINAVMGGGKATASSGQLNVTFSPADNTGKASNDVSVPFYTGWQPLQVNADNTLSGNVSFTPQGTLVVARVKRDAAISSDNSYQLFSTSLASTATFNMTQTTNLGQAATPTAPTYTVGGTTTGNYYVQTGRNITTETGYDKFIFWGMPTAPLGGQHATKVLPAKGGYWLSRDNSNNETFQAIYAQAMPTGGVLRFTLKPTVPSDPDYYFLNPLARIAERNIGLTPGTFATDDTPATSEYLYWRQYNNIPMTTWMPAGYKMPYLYEFHAAFPLINDDPQPGATYLYSSKWPGFSLNGTTPVSVKEQLSLGNNGSISQNTYKWDGDKTWYAIRWASNTVTGEKLRCAYRYEFKNWNSSTAQLHITSRYLGEQFTHIGINDVANTDYWSTNIHTDVVRIFPIMGWIGSTGSTAQDLGVWAFYWTNDPWGTGTDASGFNTNHWAAQFRYWGTKPAFERFRYFNGDYRYPVRPISVYPIYKNG